MTNSAYGKTAKLIKSLANKKIRDKLNLFIVEGARFVSEIPESIYIEFYACTDVFYERNANFEFRDNVKIHIFTEKVFSSFSDTVTPQGIIAVCGKIAYSEAEIFSGIRDGIYLVLEGIRNPGNMGTIIRTADASGIKALLISENSVDVYNMKVLRSTMGSVFNLPFIQGLRIEQILDKLKNKEVTIIGTSLNAVTPYYDECLKKSTAIIIGSEDFGMSEKARGCCDRLIKIPMEGSAESLNASVAAAVIMYEALRQRRMEK